MQIFDKQVLLGQKWVYWCLSVTQFCIKLGCLRVLAPSWDRPSMLKSFRQFQGERLDAFPKSFEALLSSDQNSPHMRVAHLGAACPEPHH